MKLPLKIMLLKNSYYKSDGYFWIIILGSTDLKNSSF